MSTDKPRFSVTFTDDAYKKIKKYQIENRISTQSKAVAALVEIAINEIESKPIKKADSVDNPTTEDIFASIEQQHDRNTQKAFSMYVQLDQGDQGEIRGEMKQMLKADKYKVAPCSKGVPAQAV